MSLDIDLNDRIVDPLDEGFDPAVRLGELKDSSLIARRIAPIRYAACTSPGYLRLHGTPRTPDDLAGHKGLVYANVDERAYWRFKHPATGVVGHATVPSVLRINNGDALREAATGGHGIALLPTFIIHSAVKSGALEVVSRKYERPPVALYAVYPSRKHLPARIRGFVDFVAARFGIEPYRDRDVYPA